MHDGLRDRDVGIASLGAGPETRTDPLLVQWIYGSAYIFFYESDILPLLDQWYDELHTVITQTYSPM